MVDLLALSGELDEHLVDPATLRAHDRGICSRRLERRTRRGPRDDRRRQGARRGRRSGWNCSSLVEAYRAAKAAADVVDFGDQMAMAARLAEERPAVGAAERARFGIVLLDEYQDTSVAQRRMLVGLSAVATRSPRSVTRARPSTAGAGRRWPTSRTSPATSTRATDGSTAPAIRYSLRENRRNGELVLDLANTLAGPLREVHNGVAPLLPAAGNRGKGEIRTALLPTTGQKWTGSGSRSPRRSPTGIAPAQVDPVLVRATRDIGPVYAELYGRDIPVEVVGLGGLVHLPEIADVIAVLEVLDDACANAALVRLLVGPRWRIGARDLALLGRRAADLVAVSTWCAGHRPGVGPRRSPTRPSGSRLSRRSATPGRISYSAACTRALRAPWTRSCAACAATSGSPCWTWCTACSP